MVVASRVELGPGGGGQQGRDGPAAAGAVVADEPTLKAWKQESWWTDQLRFFSGPDPGL